MVRSGGIVIDYDAPSTKQVIARLTDAELRRILLRMAFWHTRSDADAEDLLADASIRVMDPEDQPWNSEERPFLAQMSRVMRQHWTQQTRRLGFHNEQADGGAALETTASDVERPDDRLERLRKVEVERAIGKEIHGRLDAKSRSVFELCMGDDLTWSKQAELLGYSVATIEAAHKQMKYHGRIVRKEWDAAENRRMNALKEKAKRDGESNP
jgi:RNA polymerase sigma factor (sigma-70 family)